MDIVQPLSCILLSNLIILQVLFAHVTQYCFPNHFMLSYILNSCVRSICSSIGTAQTQGNKDNASSQSSTPVQGSIQGTGPSNGSGTGAEDRAKLLRAVVPCQQTLSLLFDARHIGWYNRSHRFTLLFFF